MIEIEIEKITNPEYHARHDIASWIPSYLVYVFGKVNNTVFEMPIIIDVEKYEKLLRDNNYEFMIMDAILSEIRRVTIFSKGKIYINPRVMQELKNQNYYWEKYGNRQIIKRFEMFGELDCISHDFTHPIRKACDRTIKKLEEEAPFPPWRGITG